MSSDRRDELRAFLSENDIATDIYYPLAFHQQKCFRSLGYVTGDLPCSEYAAEHTLALPIYPELTSSMQDHVISKIDAFYS